MSAALQIVPRAEPKPLQFEALLEAVRQSRKELELAWVNHLNAVLALQKSKTWKAYASTWEAFCEQNPAEFYAASTYRVHAMTARLAETIMDAAAETQKPEGYYRAIHEKLKDVVPKEDRHLIPSVWQLCYAYEPEASPRKDVIEEAYEIIKEERDSNTISFAGETVNVKELAQKFRLKERVAQTIQVHSAPTKKLLIQADSEALAFLRKRMAENDELPPEGASIVVSWKVSNA